MMIAQMKNRTPYMENNSGCPRSNIDIMNVTHKIAMPIVKGKSALMNPAQKKSGKEVEL